MSEELAFAREKYRAYLDRVDEQWLQWLGCLDPLDTTQRALAGTCGEWSVDQLLVHIGIWDDVARDKADNILADRQSHWTETTDEFNARTLREAPLRPVAELQSRMEATHEAMCARLAIVLADPAATAAKLEAIEYATAGDTWQHYDEHRAQIEARFDGAARSGT